jgi:hypothetical protein
MSRPQKKDRRDQQLNIGLTRAEYNIIKSRAVTAGVRVVDYGRMRLLGPPGAQHAGNAAPRFDRLVYVQLKRLGNNLNQLVRRFHLTGDPPAELDPLLKEIRDYLRRRVFE